MVRLAVVVAVLGAFGSQATAQDVNWLGAGGDLFGAAPPAEAGVLDAPVRTGVEPLSQPYQALIDKVAGEYGLDPKLLHALIATESAYQPGAVSSAGAGGLTQLMPETARALGVRDRFDPLENVRGGAEYLARQIRDFRDLRLALAAYNAGPARVARLGRVPEIPETRAYVESVISCFLALTAGRTVINSRQCRAEAARP